jgi:hypothetical protein
MPTQFGAGVALAALAMVVAGCTGSFNVKQTEPLKVQLDGQPETVQVSQGAPAKTVVVENTQQAASVHLNVTVQPVSGPCRVKITVEDEGTHEKLAERTVDCSANATATPTTAPTTQPTTAPSGNGTAGPTTAPTTTQPTSPFAPGGGTTLNVAFENITVNVRGHDNLVVITEAQDGSAVVNIAATAEGASSPSPTTNPAVSSTSEPGSPTSSPMPTSPPPTTTYPTPP